MTKSHAGEGNPNWKGGLLSLRCLECGVTFQTKRKNRATAKYCSAQCRHEHLRKTTKGRGNTLVTKRCTVCSKEIKVKKSHALKEGKFCSRTCKWSVPPPATHTRAKGGTRPDIGIFVRSSWEANWARYLNWLKRAGQIATWEYEPCTFAFPVKRGARFYTPDFRVTELDSSIHYDEVKGWMDPKSKTKLKRMAKYHPQVKIALIDALAYRSIAQQFSNAIPNWE